MLQAGRSNRGHMMKKIKMYNTSLTTMDAELFKKIKILAEKFNKDQNELLEEAAQDLIKKYEHKISSPNVKSLPNVNSDDSSKIEMIV
jgi:dihydroorotate dehydrogenase